MEIASSNFHIRPTCDWFCDGGSQLYRNRNYRNGIMCWGCVGFYGPGELVEVDGAINSERYIEVLRENLRQSVENIFGDEQFFILQQDNAPAHTARRTARWLEDEDITVMNWPAYSPDLNIIENVWSYIITKLRENPPNDLDQLRQCVFHHWANLPEDYLRKLFNSLPRRVQALINSRGYPLKY